MPGDFVREDAPDVVPGGQVEDPEAPSAYPSGQDWSDLNEEVPMDIDTSDDEVDSLHIPAQYVLPSRITHQHVESLDSGHSSIDEEVTTTQFHTPQPFFIPPGNILPGDHVREDTPFMAPGEQIVHPLVLSAVPSDQDLGNSADESPMEFDTPAKEVEFQHRPAQDVRITHQHDELLDSGNSPIDDVLCTPQLDEMLVFDQAANDEVIEAPRATVATVTAGPKRVMSFAKRAKPCKIALAARALRHSPPPTPVTSSLEAFATSVGSSSTTNQSSTSKERRHLDVEGLDLTTLTPWPRTISAFSAIMGEGEEERLRESGLAKEAHARPEILAQQTGGHMRLETEVAEGEMDIARRDDEDYGIVRDDSLEDLFREEPERFQVGADRSAPC
jgi:hypothetical protein